MKLYRQGLCEALRGRHESADDAAGEPQRVDAVWQRSKAVAAWVGHEVRLLLHDGHDARGSAAEATGHQNALYFDLRKPVRTALKRH